MLTNFEKNVIYAGSTNNLPIRLVEHWLGLDANSFTRKYNLHYLVWFEETKYVLNAIAKEKELKAMYRSKKKAIITELNPGWRFLNEEVLGNWPPNEEQIALAKDRKERSRFS